MRPRDTIAFLTKVLPQRKPIFLWGPPGIGKSQVVKQTADLMEGGFIDLRPATLDPVDLRGIPAITKEGRAKWCLPTFFPSKGKGVLFLDELAQAPTEVQNGLLELALDRHIGEYSVPDDWYIVAAGNRQSDRAGAGKLTTALSSRFIHVELEVSREDWQLWAARKPIHPLVRGFISFRPELLHKFDPRADVRNFPCPRSWEMTAAMLDAKLTELPKGIVFEACSGAVGKEAAQEFVAFLEVFSKLPNIDDLLEAPDAAPVFTEPSVAWALAVALCERVPKLDPTKQLKGLVVYATRCRKELATFVLLSAWEFHERAMMRIPQAMKWINDNAAMINPKLK